MNFIWQLSHHAQQQSHQQIRIILDFYCIYYLDRDVAQVLGLLQRNTFCIVPTNPDHQIFLFSILYQFIMQATWPILMTFSHYHKLLSDRYLHYSFHLMLKSNCHLTTFFSSLIFTSNYFLRFLLVYMPLDMIFPFIY